MGLIPGSGRSPGKGNGNLVQYSCLGNPMDRGAWWATVHGVPEESDVTQQQKQLINKASISRNTSVYLEALVTEQYDMFTSRIVLVLCYAQKGNMSSGSEPVNVLLSLPDIHLSDSLLTIPLSPVTCPHHLGYSYGSSHVRPQTIGFIIMMMTGPSLIHAQLPKQREQMTCTLLSCVLKAQK